MQEMKRILIPGELERTFVKYWNALRRGDFLEKQVVLFHTNALFINIDDIFGSCLPNYTSTIMYDF